MTVTNTRLSLQERQLLWSGDEARKTVAELAEWFDAHQRPLPWRKDFDPYHVLVSEFMAQQTVMAAVLPYFQRWVSTFPTVGDLALAKEDEVAKLWAGLGYYSRCRNLLRAAKEIVASHGGQIPSDVSALRELPGVGVYTAAAVSSIAFNKPEPLLDGNVRRVLSRLMAYPGFIGTAESDELLLLQCARLLEHGEPRIVNQALMELGGICLPKKPLCGQCPLEARCQAWKQGKTESIPRKLARVKPIELQAEYSVLLNGHRVAMMRSPKGAWWQGLWIFPFRFYEAGPGQPKKAPVAELPENGMPPGRSLLSFTHCVTKYRIRVQASLFAVNSKLSLPEPLVWLKTESLAGLPMPMPSRRIAEALDDGF